GQHRHDREKSSNDRPAAEPVPQTRAAAGTIAVPDFVALDVETTGLDFKHDRVIEIGAARFVDGKPEREFVTFINAGVPIPDHITRITNITGEDIRHAPKFADIAMELLEFIGSLPVCGHQTEFDLTFINAELKRAAFPEITPQIIDTALMSRVLLQHVGRFSLKHACEASGVTLNNAHRALHDAKASGELAVKLIPKLGDLPLEVRQALAAFAPGSMFKTLAIRSLFGARYGVNLKTGEPLPAQLPKVDTPEWFLRVDRGDIVKIFGDCAGADGVNANNIGDIIKGFTPRPAQMEMALNVADALNDNGILVAEAGTGTGKSLAYLVPAAFHALKNNCRVIISTHTRNLQDQLIGKDIPAAAAICERFDFDSKGANGGASASAQQKRTLRYTKLKGRGNYLCRSRFYKLLRGETGNLSPRERNAVLPLVVWSQYTVSGDVEEQTFFNPRWFFKTWNMVSADSQDCAGRRCPYSQTCFLNRARQLAQTSHIVVINHALFYSDICSETSFLGSVGSIIFDEAHHLESSGHQHLRTEFDTNRTTAFLDKLQNLLQTVSACKDAADTKDFEKELKNHLKHLRKRAPDLLHELDKWASAAAPGSEGEYQIPIFENSLERLLEPAVFDITLSELQDSFHQFRQVLSAADKNKADELREVTSACAEQTSQLRADLQYLIAARTDEHVFWLEGSHEKKWTKLCGVPLDISALLAEIWERCNGGIVFTSATLATGAAQESSQDPVQESAQRPSKKPAQSSTGYFKRAAGLEGLAGRVTSVILPSPYSMDQTLFGAFRTCPEPDSPAYPEFAAGAIAAIHSNFGKNILVLFTSNAMLNNVYSHLKSRPEVDRNNILAQGFGGNRNAILEQFKAQSGMILLGTDSFWEGIDAPGEACEAVIIPRLPFPVPTHPLTQALGKRMEELYGSSFFSYSVPEAIIKFRQGAGRLIRTDTDRGALIVLDNRILTKGYGKQFSRALGGTLNEFAGVDGMVGMMRDFFAQPLAGNSGTAPSNTINGGKGFKESKVTYVPFEDL
ncbi:MAG: exonuclease domain-containing protein, partial [Chitinispirillia bacterium]|nr:exonuclease domain-containing protein [Chitinispirillia bacterium]